MSEQLSYEPARVVSQEEVENRFDHLLTQLKEQLSAEEFAKLLPVLNDIIGGLQTINELVGKLGASVEAKNQIISSFYSLIETVLCELKQKKLTAIPELLTKLRSYISATPGRKISRGLGVLKKVSEM